MGDRESAVSNCKTENKEWRNSGLDCLKIICAFLVICIHIPFPGAFGACIVAWSRIAVPIFFIITGYFYEHTKQSGRCKTQLIKILKILLYSMVFYYIFNGILAVWNNNLASYLTSTFSVSIRSIVKFLIFNFVTASGHLWYLAALISVLVVVAVCDKFFSRKVLYPFVPILFLAGLILEDYSSVILGRQLSFTYTRNWLLFGLPFFLVGDMIREKGIRAKEKLWILVPLLMSMTLFECTLLMTLNVDPDREYFASSLLLSVVVFLLFKDLNSEKLKGVANIGKKYTLMIYIIHPAFIAICCDLAQKTSKTLPIVKDIWDLAAPCITFILALIFAIVWGKLTGLFNRAKKS